MSRVYSARALSTGARQGRHGRDAPELPRAGLDRRAEVAGDDLAEAPARDVVDPPLRLPQPRHAPVFINA